MVFVDMLLRVSRFEVRRLQWHHPLIAKQKQELPFGNSCFCFRSFDLRVLEFRDLQMPDGQSRLWSDRI